jgi:hypothetical protein
MARELASRVKYQTLTALDTYYVLFLRGKLKHRELSTFFNLIREQDLNPSGSVLEPVVFTKQ